MTGDPTDKRPPGERTRRGARREPAVLDLKADSVETAPAPVAGPEAPAVSPDVIVPPATDPAVEGAPSGAVAAHAGAGAHPEAGSQDAELAARPADVADAEAEHAAHAGASSGKVLQEKVLADAAHGEVASPVQMASPDEAGRPVDDMPGEHGAAIPDEASAGDRAPEPAVSSVPPISPSSRPPRAGLLGPALAGLAAGFVGAGLLTVGFLLFGPAGDIGDRLAGLENALGERASRRTVEALEKRVAGLDGTSTSLRGDLDGLAKKVQEIPAADLPALYGRVDRVERNLADLAAQPRPAEGQAATPAPQPPPLVAARESAVLAIALLLRDALDRGTPYGRELEALQSAGAPAGTIEALQPFAATGAPGAPALARDFSGIAERIANPPPPPARTISDRVSATMSGLFKVRPVGEAEGDSPAALAARAEALLQRGALKDAAAAIGRIPPADAAPAKEFQARLEARIAASDAASTILSKAVDELLAAARLQGATR